MMPMVKGVNTPLNTITILSTYLIIAILSYITDVVVLNFTQLTTVEERRRRARILRQDANNEHDTKNHPGPSAPK